MMTLTVKKIRYKFRKVTYICTFLLMLIFLVFSFAQDVDAYESYTYTFEGEYRKSAPIYMPSEIINPSSALELALSSPSDFFISADGIMYIADTKNNRLVIYGLKDGSLQEINEFDYEGHTHQLDQPQGLCLDKQGNIYIADTENSRIIILNKNLSVDKIIENPSGIGITDSFVYKPISVAVGDDDRIYTVSGTSNMGILSFAPDGLFEGFIGVQPVVFSKVEMFWRTFMTRAQREKIQQNIPVDFTDIEIDDEGFIFAVSAGINKSLQYSALISKSKESTYAPIKRLNASGDDILKRTGFYPPAGDLDIDRYKKIENAASSFNSVSVNKLGLYSVSDGNNQRIFTYLPDGDLLNVFGGNGVSPGNFQSIAAISYWGDSLYVLDSATGGITVFELTEYGKRVQKALELQNQRKYDEALKSWEEILDFNTNQDIIYTQMGRAYLRTGDYDQAMKTLKIVGEKEYYSKAMSLKRNSNMNKIIWIFPLVLILIALLISKFFKKINALNNYDNLNPPTKISVAKELQFSFETLFHPFDGFYTLKRYKRGGVRGGSIIMLMSIVAFLLYRFASGYIFSIKAGDTVNVLTEALKFITPFILFIIANFAITSLFDGEGKFKEVFATVSYSMLPLLLLLGFGAILANFLTLDEAIFLTLINIIGYAWSFFLIFTGTLTIHQYSFSKNMLITIFSIFGIVIIAFLLMLFASLSQKFFMFIKSVFIELSYRI